MKHMYIFYILYIVWNIYEKELLSEILLALLPSPIFIKMIFHFIPMSLSCSFWFCSAGDPILKGNLGCLASDVYRDQASHPSQSPPGALSIYTDRFSFNLFFSNCPAMLSSEGPSAIWWILLCWGHWPLSSFPLFQPHRSWFRLDLVALVTCPLDWILETLGIFVP